MSATLDYHRIQREIAREVNLMSAIFAGEEEAQENEGLTSTSTDGINDREEQALVSEGIVAASSSTQPKKSWLAKLLRVGHKKSLQEVTTQPIAEPARVTLQTLPAELHVKIFRLLDQCASTCLALTCKSFYKIHRHTYPTATSLLTRGSTEENADLDLIGKLRVIRYVYLIQLLEGYFGGKKDMTWGQKQALTYAKDWQKEENKRQKELEKEAVRNKLKADPLLAFMVVEQNISRLII